MPRRSAVGVLNGNWKQRWKDELNAMDDRRTFIIQNNKQKFGEALDVLKDSDPAWEAWYDDDEHIPNYILWTDTELIDELCRRMNERAGNASQKI